MKGLLAKVRELYRDRKSVRNLPSKFSATHTPTHPTPFIPLPPLSTPTPQSGALVATAGLAAAAPPYGLYGLSDSVQLIRAFNNGTTVPVGPALPSNDLQAQQLSAIDEKNGILYAILYDDVKNVPTFTGISLATGKVLSSVPVPFAESSFVGVGQLVAWEPGSAQLIAGGQLANLTHVIGLVNPTSGEWTHVASLNSTWLDVLGAATCFAPSTGDLIFQLGTQTSIDVFTLNIKSGAVKPFDQSFSNGQNIETCDYDPISGSAFGLGIEPSGSTFKRTIVALHPTNMTISVVGDVTDYGIESGGIAAINVASHSLYWIGQKTGAAPNDPFYLVQSSLKDGSTVSSGELCTSDPTCPWSLEYLNARF
jgi:hypothetical protein